MPLPKQQAKNKARVQVEAGSVFLNLPYDTKFHRLLLAYIAGVVSFGLQPRLALEIPGGVGRISRVIALIRGCQYSFHDLSRVEIDVKRLHTPRFNMALELGLAVMLNALDGGKHIWCFLNATSAVCESPQATLPERMYINTTARLEECCEKSGTPWYVVKSGRILPILSRFTVLSKPLYPPF